MACELYARRTGGGTCTPITISPAQKQQVYVMAYMFTTVSEVRDQ